MHDLVVQRRCPKCLAPTVEFIYHEHGTKDPPTERRECTSCGWVENINPKATDAPTC